MFNIAADATVQMEYPASPDAQGACPDPNRDAWSCDALVVAPFGVDTVVAIATAKPATRLLDWLRAHDGRRDAADIPDVVANLVADDPSARIGFTSVVTRATAP